MVRRRAASPKPSPPVRHASPPSSRAPPPPAASRSPLHSQPPPATPIGAGAPSQGPGLMAQMAATAGGVAIGSAVGHTVGHMLTGGGGHSEAAPAQQQAPASQQSSYSSPCEFEWKRFIECTQTQPDVSLCQSLNEAFKQCQQRLA